MASTASTPAIPPTMRAWVRRTRGPARSALELTTSMATPAVPTSSSTDVLIRVSHVPLQYSSGLTLQVLPRLPFTGAWVPELELSGEVVAAGNGAPAEVREPGTSVIAFQNVPGVILRGDGVLAEYVRLPGCQVVRIDPAVDMASASGIIGSGCTAIKMIRTAGIREGHRVLVNGASGSVGQVVSQMSKLRGATVVGVASGGNEAIVRNTGVDEFVDYRMHDPVPAYLAQQYGNKPFDFIFDCVGTQALFVHSPAYLKPDGALINIGAIEGPVSLVLNYLSNMFLPVWLGGVPRRYIMFSTPPAREPAIEVARMVEEGRVRIPVDSVFDLDDALAAYERVATKRARGRVVIKMRSD